MASLSILSGPEQGKRFSLDADETVVGRDAGCHVVLASMTVSRRHVRILRVDGKYFIEDLDSRCGFTINNEESPQHGLTRVSLKDNDQIRIATVLCCFHEEGAPVSE